MSDTQLFVGLAVYKATIAIAVAEQGRSGEVRYIGNFPNKPASIISQLQHLTERHVRSSASTKQGLVRTRCIGSWWLQVFDASWSLLPSCPMAKGRVKNDHRDAMALARLLRAGDLVQVWVPDPVHEAMRDQVRARQAASFDVRKAR